MKIDCIDGDFFESLGDNDEVVYCPIDSVERTFADNCRHRVLLTHNGDRGVDANLFGKFLECGKYDVWFAQNALVRHERLIPVPIGFERRRWCPFCKFDVIMSEASSASAPNKMLYGNFSLWTNRPAREVCRRAFSGQPFFTNRVAQRLSPPQALTSAAYAAFCRELLDHKFVLCPEGNGVDTHRFWETLALGRVPVVLHNVVNDEFARNLPVLILDRWEDFERESERFLADDREYDYGCMTFAYWRKKILGEGK